MPPHAAETPCARSLSCLRSVRGQARRLSTPPPPRNPRPARGTPPARRTGSAHQSPPSAGAASSMKSWIAAASTGFANCAGSPSSASISAMRMFRSGTAAAASGSWGRPASSRHEPGMTKAVHAQPESWSALVPQAARSAGRSTPPRTTISASENMLRPRGPALRRGPGEWIAAVCRRAAAGRPADRTARARRPAPRRAGGRATAPPQSRRAMESCISRAFISVKPIAKPSRSMDGSRGASANRSELIRVSARRASPMSSPSTDPRHVPRDAGLKVLPRHGPQHPSARVAVMAPEAEVVAKRHVPREERRARRIADGGGVGERQERLAGGDVHQFQQRRRLPGRAAYIPGAHGLRQLHDDSVDHLARAARLRHAGRKQV